MMPVIINLFGHIYTQHENLAHFFFCLKLSSLIILFLTLFCCKDKTLKLKDALKASVKLNVILSVKLLS